MPQAPIEFASPDGSSRTYASADELALDYEEEAAFWSGLPANDEALRHRLSRVSDRARIEGFLERTRMVDSVAKQLRAAVDEALNAVQLQQRVRSSAANFFNGNGLLISRSSPHAEEIRRFWESDVDLAITHTRIVLQLQKPEGANDWMHDLPEVMSFGLRLLDEEANPANNLTLGYTGASIRNVTSKLTRRGLGLHRRLEDRIEQSDADFATCLDASDASDAATPRSNAAPRNSKSGRINSGLLWRTPTASTWP